MISFQLLNPSMTYKQHALSLTNNSHFYSVSNIQRGTFYEISHHQTYVSPPIELYTQFSLLTYSLLFMGLLFLQSLAIFLVDTKWNKTILQDARIWNRILHAIQKSHFPFPYVNWYKGDGNCMDHLKRKKETDMEVLSTIFVNLLFNMAMLIPLGILCKILLHFYLTKQYRKT